MARGVLSPEARLLVAVEAAESEFQQHVLGSIRRSSEGGIIKVPVRQADGSPVLDEHGQPQMREVYERPKWEAGAFLLERRDPENWAKKSELQVTHTERPNSAMLTKDEPEKVINLFEQAKTLGSRPCASGRARPSAPGA